MSTDVTYNQVEMKNVLTTRFEQSCQYDESNTDLMFHKFSIAIEGIVHATVAADTIILPPGNPASAVTSMDLIQATLMHPRARFTYKIGDETLLEANSNELSANRDVDNGPKPQRCDITHIAGNKVFRVRYEIDVSIVKCGVKGEEGSLAETKRQALQSSDVLNNRWTLEDTLDENFYTTRTWSGKLRVAHQALVPQLYRGLVIPPLLSGYKRMSMRFSQTPDGLNLNYQINDKQVHAAPPSPATSWSGEYLESTTKSGAKTTAEVSVRMHGPPHADKRLLLTRCVQAIETRLGNLRKGFDAIAANGIGKRRAILVLNSSFRESLDKNEVEMRVNVLRTVEPARFLNLVKKRFGRDLSVGFLNYKEENNPVPPAYDPTTPLGIFITYTQTPCDPYHGVPLISNRSANSPGEHELPDIIIEPTSPGDLPNDPTGGTSEDESSGKTFHTHSEVDVRYVVNNGIIVMPIAKSSGTKEEITQLPVRIALPTEHKIITGERTAQDGPPNIPAGGDVGSEGDIDIVIIEHAHANVAPKLLPDGASLEHHREFEQRLALMRPHKPEEKEDAGSNPEDATTVEGNKINKSETEKDEFQFDVTGSLANTRPDRGLPISRFDWGDLDQFPDSTE